MVRARRGKTVNKLLDLTAEIVNNNYSRITKKTPAEAVESQEKAKDIAQYNKSRAVGTDGKKLEVGDYVRVRVKALQKDKGLDYKTYKDILWTKKVYRVAAVTKKAKIRKYRVNRKWYLTGMLLKTRPTDEVSEAIIKKRDSTAEEARLAKVKQDQVDMIIRIKREKQKARYLAKKKKIPKADMFARKRRAYTGARKKMLKAKVQSDDDEEEIRKTL
jgi:uncharacterized protein (DUF1015 family)